MKKKLLIFILQIFLLIIFCCKKPDYKDAAFSNDKNKSFSTAIVGDIMLAKVIEQGVKNKGHKYLFQNVADEISNADIAFANLESPASFLGKKDEVKPADITFRANPSMLYALKYAGFDIVSLANNHATDYYSECLIETMEFLDLLNIRHFGAGRNSEEASKPAIMEINGCKTAFLGYTIQIWRVKEARENEAGVSILKKETILGDIKKIKDSYNPDFLFISLHWGYEFYQKPDKDQIKLAHDIIDAGADCIIGHHPHVLQGIELYKNKLILYSMGNFLFDMHQENARESIVFKMKINNNKITDAEIIPAYIDTAGYYTVIADDNRAEKILNSIKSFSKDLNTEIEIELNHGKIIFKK